MWVFYLIFHRNLESRFSKTDFLVFSYFQNFSTLNHFTRGALKCTFCFSFSACWPFSSFTAQHHYVCLALSADGRLSLTHTHTRANEHAFILHFTIFYWCNFCHSSFGSTLDQAQVCVIFAEVSSPCSHPCHGIIDVPEQHFMTFIWTSVSLFYCAIQLLTSITLLYILETKPFCIVQVILVLTLQLRLVSNPDTSPSSPSCMMRI